MARPKRSRPNSDSGRKNNRAVAETVRSRYYRDEVAVVRPQSGGTAATSVGAADPDLRSHEIVVVPRTKLTAFSKKPHDDMAERQSSGLLHLPKELQISIFHHVFDARSPKLFIYVYGDSSLAFNVTRSQSLTKSHRAPALLLTNREIFQEAILVFLENAVVHICCRGDYAKEWRLITLRSQCQPCGPLTQTQIFKRAKHMELKLHLYTVDDFRTYTQSLRCLVTAIGRGRSLCVLRLSIICDGDDLTVRVRPTVAELRSIIVVLSSLACKSKTDVEVESLDLEVNAPEEIRVMAEELQ